MSAQAKSSILLMNFFHITQRFKHIEVIDTSLHTNTTINQHEAQKLLRLAAAVMMCSCSAAGIHHDISAGLKVCTRVMDND